MPESGDADLTAFAATVREARERRGLTLDQLADRAGLDRDDAAALESGTADPSFGTLVRLSRALDLPLSRLAADIDTRLGRGPG